MEADTEPRVSLWHLLSFLTLGVLLLAIFWPSDPVRTACGLARLPYPPGKILQSKNEQSFCFSSSKFAFRAPRDDIQAWLARCTELEPKEGIPYTPTHYLTFQTLTDISRLHNGKQHSHFHTVNSHMRLEMGKTITAPLSEYEVGIFEESFPWFTPHITHGTRYDIPPNGDDDHGTIFIDWDTNTVWVSARHN